MTAARVILAYSGGQRSSVAIQWLRQHYQAEVIALTVDVGQERDLEEIRERALALGARRAHVLDCRESFAAAAVAALRAQAGGPLAAAWIAAVSRPTVAAALAEIATIEQATMVAHASGDPACAATLARSSTLPIVAVAGEWADAGIDPAEYARSQQVPLWTPTPRWLASRHLLCRPAVAPSAAPGAGAAIELALAAGVPVAVSGVSLALAELLDSLSLIAGRHGVGHFNNVTGDAAAVPGATAPAAAVLHSAYAALRQSTAVVRLQLRQGACTVTAVDDRLPHMVNFA